MKKYALLVVFTLLVAGCIGDGTAKTQNSDGQGGTDMTKVTATIETSQGDIVIGFYPEEAPNHVDNFVKLAKEGFYDGVLFHRVIPGFMIQGGDPNTKTDDRNTWGTGGPDYNLDAEFNHRSHKRGILSMARSQDPNSAGSQFFIVTTDSIFLDRQYTVFGYVLEGMDVADKIVNLDRDGRDAPTNPEDARIVKVTINN